MFYHGLSSPPTTPWTWKEGDLMLGQAFIASAHSGVLGLGLTEVTRWHHGAVSNCPIPLPVLRFCDKARFLVIPARFVFAN